MAALIIGALAGAAGAFSRANYPQYYPSYGVPYYGYSPSYYAYPTTYAFPRPAFGVPVLGYW
jgi:hypothetical protein